MRAPFNSKLGIPPHLVRRPDAAGRQACSRRKVEESPAAVYPPGYFLALVRRHDWPPGFVPMQKSMADDLALRRAENARSARATAGTDADVKPLSFGSLGWLKL